MDRKEMVRRYRETPRPAGVYRVVHRSSGRMLLGASPDTRAMLNRIQAQLGLDSHPNRQLQADWDADGGDGFDFEVVDLLPPADDPDRDSSAELETLLELWREKLGVDPSLFY
jgi:hypothetical protein